MSLGGGKTQFPASPRDGLESPPNMIEEKEKEDSGNELETLA